MRRTSLLAKSVRKTPAVLSRDRKRSDVNMINRVIVYLSYEIRLIDRRHLIEWRSAGATGRAVR